MTKDRNVRACYRRMLDRIDSMSTDELDELRRDLEENDPDGEYSEDVQEAVEGEIAARFIAALDVEIES
jgi:hypothetical protein